jgi:hypothetical protein
MNKIKRQIRNKLKGYYIDFGDGYINIANEDGINCEFYGQFDDNFTWLTATYTINKKEQELNYQFGMNNPDELDLFVSDVKKILKF